MTRIHSRRALAVSLGLALAFAVTSTRAAWADQPAIGDSHLVTPVQTQTPYPPTKATLPTSPITHPFPGDLRTPPSDPQPPQPPDGPDDMANPTENPDPQPPTTTEPPAKPQPSGHVTPRPAGGSSPVAPGPEPIGTGPSDAASRLDEAAGQPDEAPAKSGVPRPVVLLLLAATAVAMLMLASICWRITKSPR